jgi:hypothetical protein
MTFKYDQYKQAGYNKEKRANQLSQISTSKRKRKTSFHFITDYEQIYNTTAALLTPLPVNPYCKENIISTQIGVVSTNQ